MEGSSAPIEFPPPGDGEGLDLPNKQGDATCLTKPRAIFRRRRKSGVLPKRIVSAHNLLYMSPWRHYLMEASREFKTANLWLNHFENIDFAIFEFGKRTTYLQSRFCILTMTLLSTSYIYSNLFSHLAGCTPLSSFCYMHVWLYLMLICFQLYEIVVLICVYYTMPTCVLARLHITPWYFKVTWFSYNVLSANIMSCNVMYSVILTDIARYIGYFNMMCQILLTVMSGANTCMTAIPSRIYHMYQPVGFIVLYLLFTLVYPMFGLTNSEGQHMVYRSLNWVEHPGYAILVSALWVTLTMASHLICVLTCWSRRVVFRGHRKQTRPEYGIDVTDYSPLEDMEIHCPQHWKTSKRTCCYKGCLYEDGPDLYPFHSIGYDNHISYSLAKGRRLRLYAVDRYDPANLPSSFIQRLALLKNVHPRTVLTNAHFEIPEEETDLQDICISSLSETNLHDQSSCRSKPFYPDMQHLKSCSDQSMPRRFTHAQFIKSKSKVFTRVFSKHETNHAQYIHQPSSKGVAFSGDHVNAERQRYLAERSMIEYGDQEDNSSDEESLDEDVESEDNDDEHDDGDQTPSESYFMI